MTSRVSINERVSVFSQVYTVSVTVWAFVQSLDTVDVTRQRIKEIHTHKHL